MELIWPENAPQHSANFTGLIGQKFPYSTTQYPFDKLFTGAIQSYLSEENRNSKKLESLTNIHLAFSDNEMQALYQFLYRFEEDPHFQELYLRFIEKEIVPHFSGRKISVQKKPGIRIHLPNSTTVQFHTDEWYGHGRDVYNVWLPLTHATDSGSIWLADHQQSLTEAKRLEKLKLELPEINSRLQKMCRPVEMKPGQYLFFHSKTVHGSVSNQMGYTRFSLDFRLLIDHTDAGKKSVEYYYKPIEKPVKETSRTKWVGTAYMDCRNGLSGKIGSQYQRLIIHEYARLHDICIVGDEMEIQTMSHHPSLLRLSQGSIAENAVVLFSVDSLPAAKEDREKIYKVTEENKIALFFANEDLCFPFCHSRNDIEKHYD
jgi:sporadic carbohydrate cluster 2OG-Fe(II) oxygenase